MSTPLPKKRVEEALERLPSRLRKEAEVLWHRKMKDRYPSDEYNEQHPRTAVTPDQVKLMVDLRKANLSFREIESIAHLIPNSGMGSYRVIRAYEEAHGIHHRATRRRSPRLSLSQIVRAAKDYAAKKPAKVKAAFQPIIEMLKGKRNRNSHVSV
jgi:hypothetical protein